MKNNIYYKEIFVTVFIFISFMSFCYAQINCPQENILWSNNQTMYYNMNSEGGGNGAVSYQTGSINGSIAIKIDWATFQNNTASLNDEILKKILEYNVAMSIVPQTNYEYECDVFVYYISECKATLKLVLNIDQVLSIYCCEDPEMNTELTNQLYNYTKDGIVYFCWNLYQTVSCGYKCCYRKYHCKREEFNGWHTFVDKPTTNSVTDCPESGFIDCLTGNPIPCNGDCGN